MCTLEIDRFRGRNYCCDNYFHGKTEHHSLHANFDLLHWPTREFQFCYSHFEALADDGALPLGDSELNHCDPSSAWDTKLESQYSKNWDGPESPSLYANCLLHVCVQSRVETQADDHLTFFAYDQECQGL